MFKRRTPIRTMANFSSGRMGTERQQTGFLRGPKEREKTVILCPVNIDFKREAKNRHLTKENKEKMLHIVSHRENAS